MKDVIWFKCNNLTVIKWQYHKIIKWRNRLFVESKCKCGNKVEHWWDVISNYKVTWCWKCKYSKSRKHWMHKHPLYSIYAEAKQRCNNKNHKMYKYYGWRWIKCERENFVDFYEDMWPTYKKWLTIERVNNNGNYCKENCKWETMLTQMNNTRRNHLITYRWKTQTMAQWSRELWIRYDTIRNRINNYWYSIEDAFKNINYITWVEPDWKKFV